MQQHGPEVQFRTEGGDEPRGAAFGMAPETADGEMKIVGKMRDSKMGLFLQVSGE